MSKIGGGLSFRPDREPLRHRAVPQAFDLRKNEPNPVRSFRAGFQLGKRCRVDRLLRQDEPLEIEAVGRIAMHCLPFQGTARLVAWQDRRILV